MTDYFITVKEVQELLHIKEGKAYQLIRMCNNELKAKGFITVAGRVPRGYFYERVGLQSAAS